MENWNIWTGLVYALEPGLAGRPSRSPLIRTLGIRLRWNYLAIDKDSAGRGFQRTATDPAALPRGPCRLEEEKWW